MKKFKNGDKVRPTKKYLKWEIQKFCDLHNVPGQQSIPERTYETITVYMGLISGLFPTVGTIVGNGSEKNTYRIEWKSKLGKYTQYYLSKEIEKIK